MDDRYSAIPNRYRIEHRKRGLRPLVLARVPDPEAARREAERWLGRLRARGMPGAVVVVDEATADEAAVEAIPVRTA